MSSAIRKIEDVSDDALAAIRMVSRQVFGNSHRLEIFCRVAEAEGDVFAHGLARKSGLTDKTVGVELRRLREAGLVQAVPADDEGQKRQYFRRVDGCFWDGVREFAAEVVERAEREASNGRKLRPAQSLP